MPVFKIIGLLHKYDLFAYFRLKNIKYSVGIGSTGKPMGIKSHKDVMPEHKIIPSEAFMKRVNEYEKEYEKYDFFEYFKENVNK